MCTVQAFAKEKPDRNFKKIKVSIKLGFKLLASVMQHQ